MKTQRIILLVAVFLLPFMGIAGTTDTTHHSTILKLTSFNADSSMNVIVKKGDIPAKSIEGKLTLMLLSCGIWEQPAGTFAISEAKDSILVISCIKRDEARPEPGEILQLDWKGTATGTIVSDKPIAHFLFDE